MMRISNKVKAIFGALAAVVAFVGAVAHYWPDFHKLFPPLCPSEMVSVPKREYRIEKENSHLTPYLHFLNEGESITIDKLFCIQKGEVTVGEFQHYIKSLNYPTMQQLGLTTWKKNHEGQSDDYPAFSISWEAAMGYIEWMNRHPSCKLQLPSRNQWAAAVIHYAESQSLQQGDTLQMVHKTLAEPEYLLGNLREWSEDSCANGHFLLGEDYLTRAEDIGKDAFSKNPCGRNDQALQTFGFRLITQGETTCPSLQATEKP